MEFPLLPDEGIPHVARSVWQFVMSRPGLDLCHRDTTPLYLGCKERVLGAARQ